jgi:hypothetical protein
MARIVSDIYTGIYGNQTTQQRGTRAGTRKNKTSPYVQGGFV